MVVPFNDMGTEGTYGLKLVTCLSPVIILYAVGNIKSSVYFISRSLMITNLLPPYSLVPVGYQVLVPLYVHNIYLIK